MGTLGRHKKIRFQNIKTAKVMVKNVKIAKVKDFTFFLPQRSFSYFAKRIFARSSVVPDGSFDILKT